MDFIKEIKERQKEFLVKPRENISRFVEEERKFSEGLVNLSIIQNRLGMLILFKEFHKQYASLIGQLLRKRLISPKSFKDDLRDIIVLQAVEEMGVTVIKHKNKTEPLDMLMPSLKKSYASLLEILWGKLKRIIFFARLNPSQKHLTLKEIGYSLTKLEKVYSIDLALLKHILDGKLRNAIDHEKTYFESPNFLVFMEENNGKLQEFYRITDEALIEKLIQLFVIIMSLHQVEVTVIIAHLEQLLKLDDKQLEEYCKTGVLTEEMQKEIEKNKNI
jgi:hypothetical protein